MSLVAGTNVYHSVCRREVAIDWPVMLLLYVIMLVSNYAKWIHDFGARLCYLYASIIGYATLVSKKYRYYATIMLE